MTDATEELLDWVCPTCGACGRHDLRVLLALCPNSHVVALGDRTGPRTRSARRIYRLLPADWPYGVSVLEPAQRAIQQALARQKASTGRTEENQPAAPLSTGEQPSETAAPVIIKPKQPMAEPEAGGFWWFHCDDV